MTICKPAKARDDEDGLPLRGGLNRFLTAKKNKADAGEHRPGAAEPKNAGLVFLTYFGNPSVRVKVTETKDGPKYTPADSLTWNLRSCSLG